VLVRQQQKEIKEAQKQLANASRSLNDRLRKKIKTQKESTRSMAVMTELKPQKALSCVTSRSGRAIERPAQFDEI
jgi:predicted transcriptional regulator